MAKSLKSGARKKKSNTIRKRISNLEKELSQIDLKVRTGEVVEARKKLKLISRKVLEGEHLTWMANLCRRTGLYELGLRSLQEVVASEVNDFSLDARKKQEVEYALLLIRTGAGTTASERLKQPALDLIPSVYFARGIQALTVWDSGRASEAFLQYLSFNLNPYERLIGELNLMDAFLTSQKLDTQFDNLIVDFEQKARQSENSRVLANCLEIRAIVEIKRGQESKAQASIQEAKKVLSKEKDLGFVALQKAQSLLDAVTKKSVEPLAAYRRNCIANGNWEAARSADLEMLKMDPTQKRFDRIYFGSPFPTLRAFLRQNFPELIVADRYRFGSLSGGTYRVQDGVYRSHQLFEGAELLKCLSEHLFTDLYKPASIIDLGRALYPEIHEDHFQSRHNLMQLVQRLNKTFFVAGVPLKVRQERWKLQMTRLGPLAIEVPANWQLSRPHRPQMKDHFNKLREGFSNQSFKSKKAAELLSCSQPTAKRYLHQWVEEGRLAKSGVGRATRYKVIR